MIKKNNSAGFRVHALDALRGIAIIGMVFSGVFPHENPWPAWMFHAQVGPPDFKFRPEVPGITWVDLVFPFFLFSMGASFPLALNKKKDLDRPKAYRDIVKRGMLLVFFAIALRHTNPGFLSSEPWINQLTGMIVFGCFFLVFLRWDLHHRILIYGLRVAGFLLIGGVIALHYYLSDLKVSLFQQDIIILILANMAIIGAFISLFTVKKPWIRYGMLAFFAALWLTRNEAGSLSSAIDSFHPAIGWFYRFEFLKYLNIVIPGIMLGDLILTYKSEEFHPDFRPAKSILLWICFILLLVNLFGLFTREVMFATCASIILCLSGIILLAGYSSGKEGFIKKAFLYGAFWLSLGLVFEPMDGGIKKDPSSFSYWFITSGLAFFTFIACELVLAYRPDNILSKYITRAGQNPMVAYVAGSFFVIPVFYFSGLDRAFDYLREMSVFWGPVKSIVVTASVVALTSFTTSRRWYWRT